jgi:hypothetical protein
MGSFAQNVPHECSRTAGKVTLPAVLVVHTLGNRRRHTEMHRLVCGSMVVLVCGSSGFGFGRPGHSNGRFDSIGLEVCGIVITMATPQTL